jgi:thiamine biosynthesis lipoprotein
LRSSLSWLPAGAALTAVGAALPAQAQPFGFHYDHVLGTSMDVTALAADEASALMAAAAARAEVRRLDALLSAWRPDGELAVLNWTGFVTASSDLRAVLGACEAWRAATGGAFDCRIGALPAALQDAAPGALDRALAGCRGKICVEDDGTVRRPTGARLAVDGLAKGYVIDKALAAARQASPGVQGLMIDIGGDLRCWGRAPSPDGWRVGVALRGEADNVAPGAQLALTDRALAVSGRGARDLVVDGCAVSHVLDPASGRPAVQAMAAAVVAPTAADADALSTAFMVMPTGAAMALADRLDGVEAMIRTADGAVACSQGWSGLAIAASGVTAAASAAAAAPSLDMSYVIPKLDVEPYHAPYVVAWITDANRQMVRTLLVLGAKPKWAPENFIWWRRYGRLAPQVLDSVGRPTRLPGRYALRWDGKDEAGRAVAPGRYLLHIESAREKGGHTYQTVELDFTARGARALPAKDEMGAVELKFGPT